MELQLIFTFLLGLILLNPFYPKPFPEPLTHLSLLLQHLLQHFPSLFHTPHSLPPSRPTDHHIHLIPDASLVNARPYRYLHFQKQEIKHQIDDMLRDGLIQPSHSPYSSPVLLVRKKDGTWLICVDYRALYAITVKDRFPIPTFDELLDDLHSAKWFSKLDLAQGFHQIRMASEDVNKTTFYTHHGYYEYLVMPFGLCNAPYTFQAMMNELLRPYLRRFVIIFFDDILVFSKTYEKHICHL